MYTLTLKNKFCSITTTFKKGEFKKMMQFVDQQKQSRPDLECTYEMTSTPDASELTDAEIEALLKATNEV